MKESLKDWIRATKEVLHPPWLLEHRQQFLEGETLPAENQKSCDEYLVSLANQLAILNIENGTGGPFGAVVADIDQRRIIGVGVNRVVPLAVSHFHAEMVALLDAELNLGTYNFVQAGYRSVMIAASSQMCGMCEGGVLWSGVTRVAFGADKNDVEKITNFDEGNSSSINRLIKSFSKRGISVAAHVKRAECVKTLKLFSNNQGIVYGRAKRA